MQYFTKKEMICCYRESKSDRCKGCRLTQAVTKIPYGIEENVEALVENVLDPARQKYGGPVLVNSGYRCPIHNSAVGGVANSQHTRGEAADICCGDNKRLAEIIEQNGKFDQLIRYMNKEGGIRFIHVSWKRNGINRKQKLIK